jgi:hypothetical protein
METSVERDTSVARSTREQVRHVGAVLALLVLVTAFVPGARPTGWSTDFSAFYCAGEAIRTGHDPYRAEPIGTCERRPKPAGFHVGVRHVSLPAPLPPYALASFVPLSMLPYGVAVGVWFLLLLVALAITIEAMHRTSALPRVALFVVFAPIEGYSSLYLGETAPIAVASIALAAMFVQRGRYSKAALAIAPALIAPHVGLPAAVALFVCLPRTRAVLGALATCLGAISLACAGPWTTLEYLRNVLPAHALSEAESTQQLSLTGLLHMLGVSTKLALHIGSASYFATLLVGLLLSRKLARHDRRDALIVTLPTALVLTGGVFIHVTQMPAALPAALLLFTRMDPVARRLVGAAVVLLAIPWDQPYLGLIFIPLAAGAAFLMLRDLLDESKAVALVGSLAAGGTVLALDLAFIYGAPYPIIRLPPINPHDLAEISWGLNVRAISTWDPLTFDLARLPSWFAIATIAAALIRFVLCRPNRGTTENSGPFVFEGNLVSH